MINDKGERVAGPKRPEIPPHMLEALNPVQKRVFSRAKRAESRTATKKTAKKAAAKRSAKKATRTTAKRSARKKTTAAVTPVAETKE